MSTGMLVLTVVAVLVFFGVAQRVLDRMRLTDRQALLLVAAMFVGTLLPNVELGQVSLNLGGAVIPLGVCIYLLFTCGDGKEVGRTLVGTVLTAAAVYAACSLIDLVRKKLFDLIGIRQFSERAAGALERVWVRLLP